MPFSSPLILGVLDSADRSFCASTGVEKTISISLRLGDILQKPKDQRAPAEHGKYEGPDAAMQVAKGKELYEKQCLECHGKTGEGVKDKFYPVIAGQHYKYLLRQMTEIRDGHHRNANPDMVKVIKPYTNDQLVAISAYQSSLVMPGAMCKPKAGKK